jgi:hypothetical protein
VRWSKETSGTGLTTTENWEFAIGAKEEMKEGVTVLAARRKKEWESIPVCRLRQKKIGAVKPTINLLLVEQSRSERNDAEPTQEKG